jgi:hypothetical protein
MYIDGEKESKQVGLNMHTYKAPKNTNNRENKTRETPEQIKNRNY